MRLVRNAGADRVIDLVRDELKQGNELDVMSPWLSLFAFQEVMAEAGKLARVRLLLPNDGADLGLLGGESDRASRNQLRARWLAKRCADWVTDKVEVRRANGNVPQGTFVVRDAQSNPQLVALGSFGLSTDGLGLTAGNPLNLIQASENAQES